MDRKTFSFRGYGYTWEHGYPAGGDSPLPSFLARGALQFDDCKLCCHHLGDLDFGSVRNKFLDIWEDDHGIAVAFTLPVNHSTPNLHNGIVSREINGLSFSYQVTSSYRSTIEGVDVEMVNRANAIEISIVSDPACVAARCWHRETPYYSQHTGIQTLMDSWEAGFKNPTKAMAVSSFPALAASAGRLRGGAPRQPFQKQRPPKALLDKIDAILAASGRR